jgi:hypothetical protein
MGFHEVPALFTFEGTIDAMRTSAGVENLIKYMQNGAFWSGVAVGLAAEPGVMATSASLALCDGEEVEHMALLINGTLAIGTFHWLGDLVIGDQVTLVVSEIDAGPLFVHAILRKRDKLLWTPLSVFHTRRGWMFHGVKLGLAGLAGVAILFGSIFLFVEGTIPEPRWLLIGNSYTCAHVVSCIPEHSGRHGSGGLRRRHISDAQRPAERPLPNKAVLCFQPAFCDDEESL